ncbi:hypothetical protein EJB05_46100, partial [Eragrostis curvula]
MDPTVRPHQAQDAVANGEVLDLATGVPPDVMRSPSACSLPIMGEQRENDDPKTKREKWFNDMRGWLMVLAVLVASVSYQAGLNPPGGFRQDGSPVLETVFPRRYEAFFYANTTAFATSFLTIILLMEESFYHSEPKLQVLKILVTLDMLSLMFAYGAGCVTTMGSSMYFMVISFIFVIIYVVHTMRFLPDLWAAFSANVLRR